MIKYENEAAEHSPTAHGRVNRLSRRLLLWPPVDVINQLKGALGSDWWTEKETDFQNTTASKWLYQHKRLCLS